MNNDIFAYRYRPVLLVLIAEYIVMQVSGVGLHALAGNNLFSLNVDPLSWLPFLASFPDFLLLHSGLGWFTDLGLLILLTLVFFNPEKQSWAVAAMTVAVIFFVTLMSRHIHWNFQEGFFLVLIPLCFRSGRSKVFAFEGLRYFLLFFYSSAGFLKLYYGAFLHTDHFSNLLAGQFGPYFFEGNTGWRTSLHVYLVNHHYVSYVLFLFSIALEIFAFAGFFTRRFDVWIGLGLLAFHLADWIIMDIGPFGQIAFISILFLNSKFIPADQKQFSHSFFQSSK
jgi:hypothetical protein